MDTEADIAARALAAFPDRAAAAGVIGRWSRANEALPWSPEPRARTQHWSYLDLQELIVEASQEMKEESGALRVLTMLNTGHPEHEAAAGQLYSGLQLLLPNEDMHSHRHAATAVRFVHQSDGGWTAVDGNKMYVEPKDIVVTPSMLWHEHGNDGDGHVIWQDCTDDPLVTTLAASHFELHPQRSHFGGEPNPVSDPLATRHPGSAGDPTPVLRPGGGRTGPQELHYSWAQTIEVLDGTRPRRDGLTILDLVDPQGGPMTRTIGAKFIRVPAYGVSRTRRQTGSQILIAADGPCEVSINDVDFTLVQGDTLAVPSWAWLRLRNPSEHDSVLFEYDEAPMLAALGLYREESRDDQ